MLLPIDLHDMQVEQYAHDLKNHFDILSLHRIERLKHYGLHFAKYAGRLARGAKEPKPTSQTIVDACLVSLSVANTLNQNFAKITVSRQPKKRTDLGMLTFVDAAGRFADACEKIDHLEDYRSIALEANEDIIDWVLLAADQLGLALRDLVAERRVQLAKRQVYHAG